MTTVGSNQNVGESEILCDDGSFMNEAGLLPFSLPV
jgi:hypothetical protein